MSIQLSRVGGKCVTQKWFLETFYGKKIGYVVFKKKPYRHFLNVIYLHNLSLK